MGPLSRAALRSSLLGLALMACEGAGDDGSQGAAADEGAQDEGDTGEPDEPPAPAGDRCSTSTLVIEAPSTITATLRHASADDLGAEIGFDGPVVYAKATVHSRVDLQVSARGRAFTPRVAVLWPGCSGDPSRVLGAGSELPISISDLGPDVDVLIAIAIDADDPALELEPAGEDQADALDFELELELRPVLGEGQRCETGLGRCEAGTVCVTALAGDDPVEPPDDPAAIPVLRCRRPPADSCVAPGLLAVPSPGSAAVIEIAATEPHSDAHEHSCTGWRRPDRVERLELPAGLGEAATLVISADDARVGLALRGHDCAPEHELACAPTKVGPSSNTLSLASPGLLADLAASGEGLLLFIELVDPGVDRGASTPVEVSVELFD